MTDLINFTLCTAGKKPRKTKQTNENRSQSDTENAKKSFQHDGVANGQNCTLSKL